MADTSQVYARVKTNVKDKAEDILSKLGMSPSSAIEIFYDQVIYNNGLPFNVNLPRKNKSKSKPLSLSKMDKEQLRLELLKGLDSLNNDQQFNAEDVDQEFNRKYKDVH